MDILHEILESKKREVVRAKGDQSIALLQEYPFFLREKVSLREAIASSSTGIIAEFKRKSPSKGFIHPHADAIQIGCGYEKAGASALSVLTDTPFFGGSSDDLMSIRASVSLPLLRKDFIVDPYQLYQAKAWGADAVLLIAAALSPSQCDELAQCAHSLDLEVLLEIHTESELTYVSDYTDLIGINNRNLAHFITDTEVSMRLCHELPPHKIRISESGIHDPETAKLLRRTGFNGLLMGEYFMKNSQPDQALARFIETLEERP